MSRKVFQYIILAIFIVLLIVGFISLALFGFLKRQETSTGVGKTDLLVWGIVDRAYMEPILDALENDEKGIGKVAYIEKRRETIQEEYKNAVISQVAPDILFADHTTLIELQDALTTIPFELFPLADYQNFFIPSASIFIQNTGYLAIPYLSDSLVLYYNENLRNQARIRFIATEWGDFSHPDYINAVRRDPSGNTIERALIPLGSYANYDKAVDVFLALVLQIQKNKAIIDTDVEDLLRFYANFSNPRSASYTWNSALPQARNFFIANDLIFLPEYTSTLHTLRQSNPNLVHRATHFPQLDNTAIPVTLSDIYGFGVTRSSAGCVQIPSNCQFLQQVSVQAIFDSLGVLYERENDFKNIFPFPPAIQGYYTTAGDTSTERVFIETLEKSRAIYLSTESREVIASVLRAVIVGTTSAENAAEQLTPLLESIVYSQ